TGGATFRPPGVLRLTDSRRTRPYFHKGWRASHPGRGRYLAGGQRPEGHDGRRDHDGGHGPGVREAAPARGGTPDARNHLSNRAEPGGDDRSLAAPRIHHLTSAMEDEPTTRNGEVT